MCQLLLRQTFFWVELSLLDIHRKVCDKLIYSIKLGQKDLSIHPVLTIFVEFLIISDIFGFLSLSICSNISDHPLPELLLDLFENRALCLHLQVHILQELKEEEYQDIDLLRQVFLKLKEEGLGLPLLGFTIRLKKIMEENDIKEDQIEPYNTRFCYILSQTHIS